MLNTFISNNLLWGNKNGPFLIENTSNMAHECFMIILTKKSLNFFVSVMIHPCVKFDTFSRKNVYLFYLQNEAFTSESVNNFYLETERV